METNIEFDARKGHSNCLTSMKEGAKEPLWKRAVDQFWPTGVRNVR